MRVVNEDGRPVYAAPANGEMGLLLMPPPVIRNRKLISVSCYGFPSIMTLSYFVTPFTSPSSATAFTNIQSSLRQVLSLQDRGV
ncbi:unnamed protein product [Amoebophrya sp. A25]|nr:unnamed protein product [Amoebophrya sp. A25]CAD7955618.1 unnamed protein product [Amoebophrya sp. A25]|eukprot:GSA25T00013587001.1